MRPRGVWNDEMMIHTTDRKAIFCKLPLLAPLSSYCFYSTKVYLNMEISFTFNYQINSSNKKKETGFDAQDFFSEEDSANKALAF